MRSITSSRPLNAMFVITSMPVGGAETLLVNMLHRFDRNRIAPSLCCLKEKGELGESLSADFHVYSRLIHHKFDVGVIKRLRSLFRQERIDAVVTVGAGDKMCWGRLAARYAKIPVILSALHSTGWPDGVGRLNRLLTGITSGFIAVARSHGQYLVQEEGFPAEKVFVIPNGVDTDRFRADADARLKWRNRLAIPADSPVVGIVAALRPEKNHALFVETAAAVLRRFDNAHFVIVGSGQEHESIKRKIDELRIASRIHMLGCTLDVPGVLSLMDLFALTSLNEASPVSIMEAMSCQRPVVATRVGSVAESVIHEVTGLLVANNDVAAMSSAWCQILENPGWARKLGIAGRQQVVANSSLDSMTDGYSELIERVYSTRQRTGVIPSADLATTPTTVASSNS